MTPQNFTALCKKAFKRLSERYSLVPDEEGGDATSAFFSMKNQTTGIKCIYDERDAGVFVRLARLSKGRFPERPPVIRKGTRIDSFFADDLITLRAGREELKPRSPVMSERGVEQYLEDYARLLERHAGDVLSGDFKVFSDVEKIIKARKGT